MNIQAGKAFILKHQRVIGLLFCLAIAASFSTYKLTESPQTWFDEGIFLQIARNAMTQHPYALRVSPTELVPAGAISTVGFTVIEPVSLSFRLFGIGLLQARAVMVLFILLLTATFYLFACKAWNAQIAWWSTLLLVTHAPVYGNGKNVLGEVPGLLFFFILLYLLHRLEDQKVRSASLWAWTGFIAGLFMATKPNFLLLLPVLISAIWLRRKRLAPTWKDITRFLVALVIPIALNILLQFGSWGALVGSFGNYGMPGLQAVTGLTLPALILRNASWFFLKATPAYVLITVAVWLISLWVRFTRKTSVPMHELVALGFAAMTVAYFLKMPGFYRYLFVAQVITFPYFVAACSHLVPFIAVPKLTERKLGGILATGLTVMILFQSYQMMFSSWVAGYYQNSRTKELTSLFQNIGPSAHVFFYHAPEAVTFLAGNTYSQYFDLLYFADALGKEQLPGLKAGKPDIVIVSGDMLDTAKGFLGEYTERSRPDGGKYVLYERK